MASPEILVPRLAIRFPMRVASPEMINVLRTWLSLQILKSTHTNVWCCHSAGADIVPRSKVIAAKISVLASERIAIKATSEY
jgi:hypothetical protein